MWPAVFCRCCLPALQALTLRWIPDPFPPALPPARSMTVQPVVGAEREVFYRERAAAMYATGPFALVSTKSHRGPLLQLTSLAQPCGSSAGCGERRCTRGAASQPRGVPMRTVGCACLAPLCSTFVLRLPRRPPL